MFMFFKKIRQTKYDILTSVSCNQCFCRKSYVDGPSYLVCVSPIFLCDKVIISYEKKFVREEICAEKRSENDN